MSSMGYLGLLVEACTNCSDESFSEEEDKENCNPNSIQISNKISGPCIPCSPSSAGVGNGSCSAAPTKHILFCKARGMPLDHIGSNAILQFQQGDHGVHGAELKCTHPTCIADGIKFRYCKHCAKAVAKRNFRKRHAHPELANIEEIRVPSYTVQVAQQNERFCTFPPLSPSQHSTPLLKNSGGHTKPNYSRDNNLRHNSVDFHPESQQMEIDTDFNEENGRQGLIRCRESILEVPAAWTDLYKNRPKGADIHKQQEWLQQVMKVAEFEIVNIKNETNDADEDSTKFADTFNSIKAVKEEFTNNFPPRFVTFDEISVKEGDMPRYRQHAESLSLQINTDLELLGTHSIMLDSNGSIVISCTPKT